MNTQSLVPKGELTTEDTELMLALNRAVISLIDDPRPVFRFDDALNAGNLSLVLRLRENPAYVVEYELGHMVAFDRHLWLNVYLKVRFQDVRGDYNNERTWNSFHLTPKQTTEVLRRASHPLALSRIQEYAVVTAGQVERAARETAASAQKGINPNRDDKYERVLDQATSSFFASCYTTFELAAMRMLTRAYDGFVMKFGR